VEVFTCARCDAVLTAPLSRVAWVAYAHHTYGNGHALPVLMEAGTYAVDPEPSGPPWRRWSEIDPVEAEARGVFAPVYSVPCGAPGAIVMAPGDAHGTVLIPERTGGFCCGLDGRDGPNLACARCGREVGTRIDDCSLWQATWLAPNAVRRVADGAPRPVMTWSAVVEGQHGSPPVDADGAWNPRWELAVSVTLAHLVAASGGAPVGVPDGPLAGTFRPSLDTLLPPGPPALRAALAGPGLPVPDPVPDIAIVPRHPQTGEPWAPPSGVAAVPLDAEVWLGLAFPGDRLPVPTHGRLPDGVERDDPLPRRPWRSLWLVDQVFLHTLSRLPAVRAPRLRALYDRKSAPYLC
jgi:hypothetical protein